MREKKYKKIYRAKVENAFEETEGTLIHFLVHRDYYAEVVPPGTKEAKEARLHYKVLKNGPFPLVEIELETGRYHQIRAQMAAERHPILGDRRYGSKVPLPNILLVHFRLSFEHPVTHAPILVESEELFLE